MSTKKMLGSIVTVLAVSVILWVTYDLVFGPAVPVVYKSFSTGEVVRIVNGNGQVIFEGHMPMKKLTLHKYELVWAK